MDYRSNRDTDERVNQRLPLRSALWTPGKASYFPAELTLSPDDTTIALVTGQHAIFWKLPDGQPDKEQFGGYERLNDAVIPTHGWDRNSQLKVQFPSNKQIDIRLVPGDSVPVSKDVTIFGSP